MFTSLQAVSFGTVRVPELNHPAGLNVLWIAFFPFLQGNAKLKLKILKTL